MGKKGCSLHHHRPPQTPTRRDLQNTSSCIQDAPSPLHASLPLLQTTYRPANPKNKEKGKQKKSLTASNRHILLLLPFPFLACPQAHATASPAAACTMVPRLWTCSSSPPSSCTGLLEATAHGDSGKWLKVCWPRLMPFGSLIILTSVFVSIVILEHHTELGARWRASSLLKPPDPVQLSSGNPCEAGNHRHKCMGIDSLPRDIIQETSDLQFRALGANPVAEAQQSPSSQSLLAMPVGIKQKETVNKIIEKFPADKFMVMLFHYDGVVDEWNIFPWSGRAIHVAAPNQTKWWFAKRFLHPDIVATYKYIFIWDEDIGVENFHAGRYLTIVEEEGLEISQPALDPLLSEIHHQITARRARGKVHRRIYKLKGSGLCFENSTKPPCTGWVEMMVPVFSRAAWRCSWYMIQNDLVHAWGLDMKLGYCAQGDRSLKVGVVDDQYVVHYGIPSLGGLFSKVWDGRTKGVSADPPPSKKAAIDPDHQQRGAVRRRSYVELEIFRQRWNAAAKKDECWADPY